MPLKRKNPTDTTPNQVKFCLCVCVCVCVCGFIAAVAFSSTLNSSQSVRVCYLVSRLKEVQQTTRWAHPIDVYMIHLYNHGHVNYTDLLHHDKMRT